VIILIDRLTGKELGNVPDSDLTVIQECLVEEDEWDTDYYLHSSSLELLSAAGLSPDAQVLLQQALGEHTDLEFGWERASDCPGAILGKIVNNEGRPVPGCKVELHRDQRNQYWGFSRTDGKFEVSLPLAGAGTMSLRISGLSDHAYWEGDVEVDPAVAVDAGTFTVTPEAPPAEVELVVPTDGEPQI